MHRYALASNGDIEAGLVWSTGGIWSRNVPKVEELMTGEQVDAFVARHCDAVVVDVIVYREMCDVHCKAFRAVIDAFGGERSTPEVRAAAREAGRRALILAGFEKAAAKHNPFNPCEA